MVWADDMYNFHTYVSCYDWVWSFSFLSCCRGVGTIVLIDYATTRSWELAHDEYWLESTVSSLYSIVLLFILFIFNSNSRGWRKYSSYFRYLTLVLLNEELIQAPNRTLYTFDITINRFDPSYGIHDYLYLCLINKYHACKCPTNILLLYNWLRRS